MKIYATIALAAALYGTPATAAAADTYVATPATASTRTSFITRSTVWHAQDGAFVAGAVPERPAVLCELVARQIGRLSAFTVAGKAYDADQLAKCNAKAKKA